MAYITNYRIQFNNIEGQACEVLIEDTASGTGTATYNDMTGTATPCVVRVIDNNTDPFAPIKAKECVIEFVAGDYDINTFAFGYDNRFKVTYSIATVVYFVGYLVMDEMQQDYQPVEHGIPVRLTATDNIGTLKDVDLTNFGAPITDGHFSIVQYLAWIFKATNLQLNINVVWNVREEDSDTNLGHLETTFIHSLTFEKEIGTKEDCYTVLQKICNSLHARCFQENGSWWFVRIHEQRWTNGPGHSEHWIYDYTGDLTSHGSTYTSYYIGHSYDAFFINEDQELQIQRTDKYNKDVYKFEYPKEIIPNIDFSRGTFISGTNPKLYTVANWTLLRSSGGSYSTPDNTARIEKTYDVYGAESSRILRITAGTASNVYYLKSEEIPVGAGDKFNTGVEFKWSANYNGNSGTSWIPIMQVRLSGDDGSEWLWTDGTSAGSLNNSSYKPQWVNVSTPGTFINVYYYMWHYWDTTKQDETEWMGIDCEMQPVPVSGNVQICLIHAGFRVSNVDMIFGNLRFEYIPYINGTYTRYTGQHNKITSAYDYKSKKENDLVISNSPKKLFKGALKKYNGTAYVLTEGWTDDYDGGASGSVQQLSRILAYDYWNQYRMERTVLSGSVKVEGSIINYTSLFKSFRLEGPHDLTDLRRFILLSYEVDMVTLIMKATFIEIRRTNASNDYSTDHEFKYIQ